MRTLRILFAICMAVSSLAGTGAAGAASSTSTTDGVAPNAYGLLDCNGFSPIQKLIKPNMVCTDPRALYDGKPARFYDNGHYIGHDEPSTRFLSDLPGSGNDVTWNERLPKDPAALPTVASPGRDVTHWFELSIAPWFGMALCDPFSYPQAACKPNSDTNAPNIQRRRRGQLLPRSTVLRARLWSVHRQHQLRQQPLVRLTPYQRPRVHRPVPPLQLQLHRAHELRLHPAGRCADRPAEPAAGQPGDRDAQREDVAHEPG